MSAIRNWLTGTFAGRALLIGAVVKSLTLALGLVAPPSASVEALDTLGDISLVAGAAVLAYRLFVVTKRRLLWRVRRRLTLSYIFIGFVPALLIITFFLLCGVLVVLNLSSYLMQVRVRGVVDQAQFLAQAAALESQRAPDAAAFAETLRRRQGAAASRYPAASYAAIAVDRTCDTATARARGAARPIAGPVIAGPWAHLDPPSTLPSWVTCAGHAGLIVYTEGEGTTRLAVRAVALPDDAMPGYAVVVDVPMTMALAHQLRDDTGTELGAITAVATDAAVHPLEGRSLGGEEGAPRASSATATSLLERPLPWVTFLDYRDWNTGSAGTLTASISTSVAGVYDRFSTASLTPVRSFSFDQILLVVLGIIAASFMVIQVVALGTGLALARSITGSVHQLFTGTERVRMGDFTHKIPISTRDQLGDLAESFNSMTASIEDLLQQKAEKERLEQELKIAREIQMSLLPQGPLRMPGLALTGHCEPAREVGGDYYDFLPLDEHSLGLLIADVAGKGTSAALYMAELKGVMFSLSQLHRSPRALLIAADRILSRHLAKSSFITITYAVVDLKARTLTYARAGHCPLIYMPGPYAPSPQVQILAPDGLVLGLQIDNGEMFTRLLEEVTVPLGRGDLLVLFTDGITEAMNPAGECFGEQRLGALIQQQAHLPFEELRERILREVNGFVGSAAQQDDMTMLLLKVEDVGVSCH
ncbi:MAG TPA: SpoIIE family protein phosphatase [Vicinamibacterales bacterium]